MIGAVMNVPGWLFSVADALLNFKKTRKLTKISVNKRKLKIIKGFTVINES